MTRPKLIELVLKNLFSKPATVQFPYQKTDVEPDYRGIHYADLTKCIGCSLCAIECPADAIKMIKIPSGYEGVNQLNKNMIYPLIDYGKCVYCYRCVKVCPVNAFITTNKYDIAGPSKPTSEELSLSTLKKVG
ncbi:MAG: 4Fe-4S binding protein [Ignisphaera sp.]|nr:4Fe-4S binding protein [Ignisphaera sp.]